MASTDSTCWPLASRLLELLLSGGISRGELSIVLAMERMGMAIGSILLGSVADGLGRCPIGIIIGGSIAAVLLAHFD